MVHSPDALKHPKKKDPDGIQNCTFGPGQSEVRSPADKEMNSHKAESLIKR